MFRKNFFQWSPLWSYGHTLNFFSTNFENFQLGFKSLRGDHRTKGETIEKKFFETCFYEFKMILLMKENVFDGFRAI